MIDNLNGNDPQQTDWDKGGDIVFRASSWDEAAYGFCLIEMIFDDAGKAVDYCYLEVNKAFEKQSGLANVQGRTVRELIPELEEYWFAFYGRVAITGNAARFEAKAEALGYWFDITAFPYGQPGQGLVAVLFNNITVQKGFESALISSNDRMAMLIDSATDSAIFTLDKLGQINSWNPGAQRLFGYGEREVIGHPFSILFTVDDAGQLAAKEELRLALRDGRAADERWHLRKDGTRFFASGVIQPLGTTGEDGFVKICRDVTLKITAQMAERDSEMLKTLVNAQEAERSRIARDLHDELGQRLTALRFKLQRFSEKIPAELVAGLEEIEAIAVSIDDGVDFLAWELHPAALDDLGLIPAIEKYIHEWTQYSEVKGELATSLGDMRFDTATETALYRVIQEALNNIHKHAKATETKVTLTMRDENIVLIIDDNGRGFDQAAQELRKKGIGLVGMNERVQIVGGTMEIESNPGLGTTFFFHIPTTPSAPSHKLLG